MPGQFEIHLTFEHVSAESKYDEFMISSCIIRNNSIKIRNIYLS